MKDRIKQLKETQIDEYLDLRDKIIQHKYQVKELWAKRKRYLLNNSKYIFNYFEQKKDISVGGGNQHVNVLNNFFKIKAITQEIRAF
jgi:hypothetical protein